MEGFVICSVAFCAIFVSLRQFGEISVASRLIKGCQLWLPLLCCFAVFGVGVVSRAWIIGLVFCGLVWLSGLAIFFMNFRVISCSQMVLHLLMTLSPPLSAMVGFVFRRVSVEYGMSLLGELGDVFCAGFAATFTAVYLVGQKSLAVHRHRTSEYKAGRIEDDFVICFDQELKTLKEGGFFEDSTSSGE